jgi:4a-hydroxytetrahydrobiopterin dehydratase
MTAVATAREVEEALASATGWRRRGEELVRVLDFREFEEALRFMERVAACAVDYRRRPDMCISEYNRLRLSITNPHRAGFTHAELRLLRRVNEILDEHHPDAAPVG